jgi:hypothetical protein
VKKEAEAAAGGTAGGRARRRSAAKTGGGPRQLTLFEGLLEALRAKAAAPRKRRVSTKAAPPLTPSATALAPGGDARPRRCRGRLETRGRCCDLAELAADINDRYFDGELATAITWARRRPRSRRRRRTRRVTLQLGSYRSDLDLVRIHPALDQPWVPRYVLESIIYHELLHAALPATIQNGRRRVHTPEFRRRERLYPYLDRAQAWIQANLKGLVESSS